MTDRYPLQTKICIVYNLILKNLSEFDILFVYEYDLLFVIGMIFYICMTRSVKLMSNEQAFFLPGWWE